MKIHRELDDICDGRARGGICMRVEAMPEPEAASEMRTIDARRLEQLQRLASVGALASSVAHEFNNILTSILNHAKLGLQCPDVDAARSAFEKILHGARRAAKITTGVLALSRNRAERRQPTDVVVLVEEILVVVEKDLKQHQVSVERHWRDYPTIELVPVQIEQVLLNIIINARQAMPGGGTLTVSVQTNHATQMVEIAIADTGIGIEPDKIGKIFEPFYTTKDGPDETGHGGSGLGLSMCREIIARHYGRIRVESVVGQGTTFIIKLPSRPPSDAASTAA
jgi:signal transduction histidine kinase